MICGFDEAGRGPLAGPVVASAVILSDDFPLEILNDSKKLSEKKRLIARDVIMQKALAYGIAEVSHEEIDKINILQASLCAMQRAFKNLTEQYCARYLQGANAQNDKCALEDFYHSLNGIVDGNKVPLLPFACSAVPKADATYPAVMAASILAKTHRDELMNEYAKLYPAYQYDKHKGYPTKAHRAICHALGPSPIQRLTFKY